MRALVSNPAGEPPMHEADDGARRAQVGVNRNTAWTRRQGIR